MFFFKSKPEPQQGVVGFQAGISLSVMDMQIFLKEILITTTQLVSLGTAQLQLQTPSGLKKSLSWDVAEFCNPQIPSKTNFERSIIHYWRIRFHFLLKHNLVLIF